MIWPMTTEVPDEMRREIVAGCKRALLLTRNYLGRDLRDDEIEIGRTGRERDLRVSEHAHVRLSLHRGIHISEDVLSCDETERRVSRGAVVKRRHRGASGRWCLEREVHARSRISGHPRGAERAV